MILKNGGFFTLRQLKFQSKGRFLLNLDIRFIGRKTKPLFPEKKEVRKTEDEKKSAQSELKIADFAKFERIETEKSSSYIKLINSGENLLAFYNQNIDDLSLKEMVLVYYRFYILYKKAVALSSEEGKQRKTELIDSMNRKDFKSFHSYLERKIPIMDAFCLSNFLMSSVGLNTSSKELCEKIAEICVGNGVEMTIPSLLITLYSFALSSYQNKQFFQLVSPMVQKQVSLHIFLFIYS